MKNVRKICEHVSTRIIYWKGSESHSCFKNAVKIFDNKIKSLDVSPLSSIVFSNPSKVETKLAKI